MIEQQFPLHGIQKGFLPPLSTLAHSQCRYAQKCLLGTTDVSKAMLQNPEVIASPQCNLHDLKAIELLG